VVPRVWLAQPSEAETVARLMAAFRDHIGLAAPSDAEVADGVERLLGDGDTEFLGRALLDATLERARARGCRRIELDVNERNDAALRLYSSFGFSATANPYGARDLYMRLHVD
jgi:GNAT superfamily N-acetyltransferase